MNYYKLEFTTTENKVFLRIHGKVIPKARYIISQILDRPLHRWEKVFFKKEKNNFLLDNLVLINFRNRTQTHFNQREADEWGTIELPTWSRLYKQCANCQSSKKKYAGGGLCVNCYQRQYKKEFYS